MGLLEAISSFQLNLFLIILGVIGIWRWSVWVLKLVTATQYEPFDCDPPDLDTSIVVPVYDEESEGFMDRVKSWAKNDPLEIIAVIDKSDKECIKKFKNFKKENSNAKLIVTDIAGKRSALKRGFKESKGDLIAFVDSDVYWRSDTKEEFLKPFTDENIGGVAPKQIVHEQKTVIQRLYEALQRVRFGIDIPALTVSARALSVVSGRTAVYRREAIEDVIEKIDREKFFTSLIISGEDKFLTRGVHSKGWDTYYQSSSVIDIGSARSFFKFLRQSLRWRRNSVRSDMISLTSKWVYSRPALSYYMLDRFFSSFAILLSPLFFIVSVYNGLFLAAVLVVVWWMISRSVKLFPFLNVYRRFLMVPVYTLWSFFFAPFQIYAFFSAGRQGWVTRGSDLRYNLPVWRYRILSVFSFLITAIILIYYVYLAVLVF